MLRSIGAAAAARAGLGRKIHVDTDGGAPALARVIFTGKDARHRRVFERRFVRWRRSGLGPAGEVEHGLWRRKIESRLSGRSAVTRTATRRSERSKVVGRGDGVLGLPNFGERRAVDGIRIDGNLSLSLGQCVSGPCSPLVAKGGPLYGHTGKRLTTPFFSEYAKLEFLEGSSRPVPSRSTSSCTRKDSVSGFFLFMICMADNKNCKDARTCWSAGRLLRYWTKTRAAT